MEWGRSVSLGPALRDRGRRGGDLVCLQILSLMGDWCRQVGTTRSETDTANSKENTAKEEMGMTLLICFAHSDTNDGRGKRYFFYGRNTFFSWKVPFNG